MNIIIELDSTQYKAFQYVATSPEEWIKNAASVRSSSAIDEIVQITVKYCLDNGISIPQTTDEIINFAYSSGIIKTAADRNAEVLSV